jgi:hypothetical protein
MLQMAKAVGSGTGLPLILIPGRKLPTLKLEAMGNTVFTFVNGNTVGGEIAKYLSPIVLGAFIGIHLPVAPPLKTKKYVPG